MHSRPSYSKGFVRVLRRVAGVTDAHSERVQHSDALSIRARAAGESNFSTSLQVISELQSSN